MAERRWDAADGQGAESELAAAPRARFTDAESTLWLRRPTAPRATFPSAPSRPPSAEGATAGGDAAPLAEPKPKPGATRPGGYNPALDGVRALAVLGVLAFHMNVLSGGYLGVDLFFVLSGFLITGLLLAEWDRTGSVRLRGFYVRRAFRLMPAFWLMTAVSVTGVLLLGWNAGATHRAFAESAAASLLFVNDYLQARRPAAGWFGHTWSLSVEEQFYLLWPLVLLALGRRREFTRALPAVLVAAALAVMVWRAALAVTGAPWNRMYYTLDTRADALLVGCALAAWLRGARPVLSRPVNQGRSVLPVAGPVALVLLAVAMVRMPRVSAPGEWILYEGGYTALALVAGVLILSLELRQPSWLFHLLAVRPLVWLGRISYGFYLWHFPVTVFLGPRLVDRLGRWPAVGAAIVLSAALASASYYLVEQPVQRRRPRWAATPAGPAPAGGRAARRGARVTRPAAGVLPPPRRGWE
jgi:peptidoglycan/LPS O-acetylase OafA/YrhL